MKLGFSSSGPRIISVRRCFLTVESRESLINEVLIPVRFGNDSLKTSSL